MDEPTTPSSKPRTILTGAVLVTLIVGAANAAIVARAQFYGFVSYATLYSPSDRPTIRDFRLSSEDRLSVDLRGAGVGPWRIRDALGDRIETDAQPSLALIPGRNTYSIEPVGEPDREVKLGIDHVPPGRDKTQLKGAFHIFESNAPLGKFDQYPISEFVPDVRRYPQEEVADARRMLQEVGVDDSEPTLTRLGKIATFILTSVESHSGNPEAWTGSMNGYRQFLAAKEGRTEVDCRNLATMTQFFAAASGIAMRRVSLYGNLGAATLSAHTLDEAYVPERNEWVLVDLVPRIVAVRNGEGRLVNAVDLLHAHVAHNFGDLVARVVDEQGELIDVPYEDVSEVHQFYFSKDATLEFYRGRHSQLRRSLSVIIDRVVFRPDLAYALNGSNALHFSQRLFLFLAISVALFWVVALLRRVVLGRVVR